MVNVTADQVIYVAPSPQLTSDGILVSFLVQDTEGVSRDIQQPLGEVIARHRRESWGKETSYFPSYLVTTALRSSKRHLETAVRLCAITAHDQMKNK